MSADEILDALPKLCFHHEVDERCKDDVFLFVLRGHTGFPVLSCGLHVGMDLQSMTVLGHAIEVQCVRPEPEQ